MVAFSDPLTEALRRYDLLTTAEAKILSGEQAYSLGGRSLTRGDLGKIQAEIKEQRVLIRSLQKGGIRIRGGVPLS
jgi:hypothetical protein